VRARARRAVDRALGRAPRPPLLESDRFALNPRLDLTRAELERNADSLRAWREGSGPFPIRTAQWIVPAFEHAAYGGIHTILRFADAFAREHGVRNRFHVYDARPGQEAAVAARIGAAFGALADAAVTGPAQRDALPRCDAAFATFWPTAYELARLDAGAKFLFLQDRESSFYPAGAASALADEALRLGFPAVVNSPALAPTTSAAGTHAIAFTPSVDTALFHPTAAPLPDAPVRVVLYARPSASRNAFGLGLVTLRRLKERFGDRVELLAAGEAWEPAHFGVPEGVVRNLGLLPGLDAVAELYRSCHVGLFFMMTPHASYQPLELMASGAACVSNENPTTGWLLEHERTALLAPPLPSLVAEQVGRLVDDPALRARIAAAGRERVAALPPWEAEIERVWRALTKAG
jgi:glycosyltransferase involved in cell wall biosynthesis